jgi:hypothetical protein
MADEHISYIAMVNHEIGPMVYTMRSGDFGLGSDHTAPLANGIGAKLARLTRRLTATFTAQRQRGVDREIARFIARSGGRITDSMEREIATCLSHWSLPE